jgi:uncharacterized cupredoxin-like copper-binding protein
MIRTIALVAVVLITLGLAGSTRAAPGEAVTLTLSEYAFTPSTLTLRTGVPVVLTLRNTGKVAHELMLYPVSNSAVKDWDEYAMANTYFQKMGEVEAEFAGRGHDSATSLFEVYVEAGQAVVIRFTPNRVGTFEMGCHLPAHYENGMKGTITVK